jgi:predicted lipid-binding transport protein (Tim44 family)
MTRRDPIVQWSAVLLVCGTLGLSGCSAGRPPTAELAQATLAVQEADKSQAPQYDPADLNMARKELESAQQAMREKEYTTARRLAERALVNAQLAAAKAETEQTRQAAAALQRSIESLRQEAESPASRR